MAVALTRKRKKTTFAGFFLTRLSKQNANRNVYGRRWAVST